MQLTKRLLVGGLLATVFAPFANSQLIDAAFGNGNATPTGAAVIGQAGDQWNVFNAPNGTDGPTALFDSSGNGTSVFITYTSEGGVSPLNTGFQPDSPLMDYYMFNNTEGDIVVSLTGLASSTSYDLFLYLSSGDANSGDRSVAGSIAGGTNFNFTATGDPQSTFINGENYIQLAVMSDASGNLTITEGPGMTNTSGEVDMNGFQLQPTAAPEPFTTLLLIGGVAGLIRRRAKKA